MRVNKIRLGAVRINLFSLCSRRVQSERRAARAQNQRTKIETDAHELHQRAAVPAGEGVRAAAVHGGLREVPPGLRSAAHRSAGENLSFNIKI